MKDGKQDQYCFQIEPFKFNLKDTTYLCCRFYDFQIRKS